MFQGMDVQKKVMLNSVLASLVDKGPKLFILNAVLVCIPRKPPWSLVSLHPDSVCTDCASQSFGMLCSYILKDNMALVNDDAQFRPLPWPSFTSDKVAIHSSVNTLFGDVCEFEHYKCIVAFQSLVWNLLAIDKVPGQVLIMSNSCEVQAIFTWSKSAYECFHIYIHVYQHYCHNQIQTGGIFVGINASWQSAVWVQSWLMLIGVSVFGIKWTNIDRIYASSVWRVPVFHPFYSPVSIVALIQVWETEQLPPPLSGYQNIFSQSCKLTVHFIVSKLKMEQCLHSESEILLLPEIIEYAIHQVLHKLQAGTIGNFGVLLQPWSPFALLSYWCMFVFGESVQYMRHSSQLNLEGFENQAEAGNLQIQDGPLGNVLVQVVTFRGCHTVMICSATTSTQ